MSYSDFDDNYPKGIEASKAIPEPLTPAEGCAFVIACFVAAAGILYGLTLLVTGILNLLGGVS